MNIARALQSVQARAAILFENVIFRYAFSFAAIVITFAFRLWLIPWTGAGAPFVLFFAMVLMISLLAGTGPGLFAVFLSMPLAANTFVVRAGYPPSQAAVQSLLFAVDGIFVVYLTSLMKRRSFRAAPWRVF